MKSGKEIREGALDLDRCLDYESELMTEHNDDSGAFESRGYGPIVPLLDRFIDAVIGLLAITYCPPMPRP